MIELQVFSPDRVIGHAGTWLRHEIKSHTLIAVPRLTLEHEPTVRLAEGASLIELFFGAQVLLDERVRKLVVLGGTPELHTRSTPTLRDFMAVLPTDGEVMPPLSDMITKLAEMLR
jgi:hypothetical protein